MVIVIFFLLLFQVIFNDVKKKKIFNESTLMCIFVGVFLLIFFNQQKISQGWADSLAAAVLFFVVFIVFYNIGFMGAGDVKFGAALAFCFGVKLFFYVWCISIFISIIYCFFEKELKINEKIIFSKSISANGGTALKTVPYGAFLSIGAMIVILGIR